jgi:hypothetical protein
MKYAVLALVASLLLTPAAFAAPLSGGGCQETSVSAHTTDIYTVTFRAGETAYVSVEGDGDTDLDLYVYDENGILIAFHDGLSDSAAVSFTPIWTGPFRIEVRNHGSVYNEYVICMV